MEKDNHIFKKDILSKAIIKKPNYVIGVDMADKDNYCYCLARKIGENIEILLSKNKKDKNEFDQEVANLIEYFEADFVENKSK